MEYYKERLAGFKAHGAGGFALDTRTGAVRPLPESFNTNSLEIGGSDTISAPGATTGPNLKQ